MFTCHKNIVFEHIFVYFCTLCYDMCWQFFFFFLPLNNAFLITHHYFSDVMLTY